MGVATDITVPPPSAPVGARDLAELLRAFNEVTERLELTHDHLRREVAALQAELRDKNEQLARSRRLAALGEMAAGIAHEVRNPLSSIRLYARMLEQDLFDRPSERLTATKIAGAVRGLDAVVGDVLTFARELRVRRSRVEASELLSSALEACQAECPGAVTVVRRDAGEAVELDGDPALIHQALVNVIRNALQAMAEAPAPSGGHALELDARLDAGRREGPPTVALMVADTGPGVGPELIDRMFNPFFTTRATGTGLGLAIVHRIVDAHGGRVVVRDRSEEGARGAVFQLHFPAAEPAAVTIPSAPARDNGVAPREEAP